MCIRDSAKDVLTGQHSDSAQRTDAFDGMFEEIGSFADTPELQSWVRSAARNLPRNYCFQHETEEISRQLLVLRETTGDEVQCWIKQCEGSNLYELCVGKRERRRAGLFYKTLGMLASQGVAVRSADIKSIGGSLVLYWIKFEDLEFEDPPQSRIHDLRDRARDLSLIHI